MVRVNKFNVTYMSDCQCKQKALISMKKAQSSLDKIMTMINDDRYCIDIMQQNLAVIGLLKSANQKLMENHLNTCFKDAVASKKTEVQSRMVTEILKVNKLSQR